MEDNLISAVANAGLVIILFSRPLTHFIFIKHEPS